MIIFLKNICIFQEDTSMEFGLLPRIITAIVLGVIIGSFAPLWFVKTAATFNDMFGNFIQFVIPFIIPGIGQIGRGAGKILGITAGIAYASTIIAGLLAYLAGSNLLPAIISGQQLQEFKNPEEVLQSGFFTIEMTPFMSVMSALIFAFIMGIGIAYLPGKTLKNAFDEFQTIVISGTGQPGNGHECHRGRRSHDAHSQTDFKKWGWKRRGCTCIIIQKSQGRPIRPWLFCLVRGI